MALKRAAYFLRKISLATLREQDDAAWRNKHLTKLIFSHASLTLKIMEIVEISADEGNVNIGLICLIGQKFKAGEMYFDLFPLSEFLILFP